ncbi:DNA mismatch repair endonuclease MutL [Candidatus Gracilibacteria bacterium]|nr:DNA mismatch repair endonuclease MutL [Candidatus Gracilibacteria bacterium]
MPQKIITLSKQLANQIAAGEVVERPISVVKELVENSIDSGANDIRIELIEGGIENIRIVDNGSGIPEEDLELALEKYSTSKISSMQELQKVMTFGFRGEALASIASVSQCTLVSKPTHQDFAVQLISHGGDIISKSQSGAENGTSIEIANLFFNTPARKNYLKTARTEYSKISDFVQNISLAYPQITFSLTHNDKRMFQYTACDLLIERVYQVQGKEFYESIESVDFEFGGIHVTGYITNPKLSFSYRSKQIIFVNNRIINSPIVAKAIIDAYARFIPHGRYPGYIIFLTLDPLQVDVNVHPRKLEVRFAQESSIFRSVYHAVKNKLESDMIATVTQSPEGNSSQDKTNIVHQDVSNLGVGEKYYSGSGTKFKNYSPYTEHTSNPNQKTFEAIDFTSRILDPDLSSSTGDLKQTPFGKIIGQSHNSYIIVENDSGLVVLDQHALAERVIYEKLSNVAYSPKIQKLLSGNMLHLSSFEIEVLEQNMQTIGDMGFEIEILSHGSIQINGVPDFLKKANIEKVFKNMMYDISEIGSQSIDEVRNKIWAYTACRSAVKFGDPLSIFEMHGLLQDASLEYSSTCPHGRPVVYEINLDDLQKKYER